jgi:hypothetical protein
VAGGQGQGDHPAEAVAEDVGSGDAEMRQQSGHVAG